jgi:hypothetical protein
MRDKIPKDKKEIMHLEAHYCISESQMGKMKFDFGTNHATADLVKKWARSLDPHDPMTSRKVLITPFNHFREECYQKVQKEITIELKDDGDAELEIDADGNEIPSPAKSKKEIVEYRKCVLDEDMFSTVIIDEAHHCTNPSNLQTKLALVFNAKRLLLTATPLKSEIKQLAYLLKFFKAHIRAHLGSPGTSDMDLDNENKEANSIELLKTLAASLEANYHMDFLAIPEAELEQYLEVLDADNFLASLGRNAGAHNAIRIACMASILHRGKGTQIEGLTPGTSYEVGKDIPPCRVVTVELETPSTFAREYEKILIDCVGNKTAARLARFIAGGPKAGEEDPLQKSDAKSSSEIHRRLRISAYNPVADTLIRNGFPWSAPDVKKM